MGWWNMPGTKCTVGDRPLDILGSAVAEVAAAYERSLQRLPTKDEWEALLLLVFGGDDEKCLRPIEGATVKGVRLDVEAWGGVPLESA